MTADWAIECQLNSTVGTGSQGWEGRWVLPSFPKAHSPSEGLLLGFNNLSAKMPAQDQWESLLP